MSHKGVLDADVKGFRLYVGNMFSLRITIRGQEYKISPDIRQYSIYSDKFGYDH